MLFGIVTHFSQSALPKNMQGKKNQLFFNLKVCHDGLGSAGPDLLNGLLFQCTFLHTLKILLIDGPFC